MTTLTNDQAAKPTLFDSVCDKTQSALYGIAGVLGTAVGQFAGRGYAVRVGSNYIYNAVYAETIATSGWVMGNITAPIAANSAVGAAVPVLMKVGTVMGGAGGFAVATLTLLLAFKIGKFVMTKIFALITHIQNGSIFQKSTLKEKQKREEINLTLPKSDNTQASLIQSRV